MIEAHANVKLLKPFDSKVKWKRRDSNWNDGKMGKIGNKGAVLTWKIFLFGTDGVTALLAP